MLPVLDPVTLKDCFTDETPALALPVISRYLIYAYPFNILLNRYTVAALSGLPKRVTLFDLSENVGSTCIGCEASKC